MNFTTTIPGDAATESYAPHPGGGWLWDSAPYCDHRGEERQNRENSTLPLRPSLAAKMRDYLADHEPSERVFFTMWKDKGFAMLKVDLKAAGIAYKDKNGEVADFHSHRHTLGSLLCNSGVPLTTAQKYMRHSTPVLTANIYSHATGEDKAAALAKLPEIESFAYTLGIA